MLFWVLVFLGWIYKNYSDLETCKLPFQGVLDSLSLTQGDALG
jgi:hypothetical protein